MTRIKQFGVKFGDNDFHNTYASMLPVIALHLYDRQNEPVTKELIARIVSNASYGFYVASQNQFQYNLNQDAIHLLQYFQVKPEQIFIDDELTDLIGSDYFHNGELFCVTIPDTFYNCEPSFWSV